LTLIYLKSNTTDIKTITKPFFAADWMGGDHLLFFLLLFFHPPTGQTAVKKEFYQIGFKNCFVGRLGDTLNIFKYNPPELFQLQGVTWESREIKGYLYIFF